MLPKVVNKKVTKLFVKPEEGPITVVADHLSEEHEEHEAIESMVNCKDCTREMFLVDSRQTNTRKTTTKTLHVSLCRL